MADLGEVTEHAQIGRSTCRKTKKSRIKNLSASCVVAPILTREDAINDPNCKDRGIFTPISDPIYGDIIAAQAQYKMTETPPRTKWVCRPVGRDNEQIYLKHLGLSPTKLKDLKARGII
jgi:crotonobetainyl-CoA:carnitine CoA-transferase CaiB-like acyl-CoA transferase